ncbi:LuxR C-terminal-related transcriptional regulator [Streptomyces sp. NPDC091215]|uniref:LuxR C-terminal-related transcriptional regulator n=1 Tax=Streptomyces sp. NPDC091215 TaxID=3155192 RepID=UPI003441C6D2
MVVTGRRRRPAGSLGLCRYVCHRPRWRSSRSAWAAGAESLGAACRASRPLGRQAPGPSRPIPLSAGANCCPLRSSPTTFSALPLAAVATAAVLWRRSHPRATVFVTAVCASAAGGVGYLLTPMLLAPVLVALYSFAAQEPPKRVYRFCLPVTAMVVLSTVFGDRYGHPWPLATVNPVLCLLLPVALGSATRIRNAYLEAVETRAKYAEQTREEEARHRVAEERVRIARELHDVVAHHLALANAQAGTLTFLARTSPDKVAPMVNQLAATTRICADPALSATRVLILTTFETDEYVALALRAGASGFLGKDVSAQTLVEGIRTVAGGEALLSPKATQTLITRFLTAPVPTTAPPPELANLTVREREVMIEAAQGKSNAEIAGELFLSPLTVRTHIHRAMTKLNARDRTQLVVIAYQSGLARP